MAPSGASVNKRRPSRGLLVFAAVFGAPMLLLMAQKGWREKLYDVMIDSTQQAGAPISTQEGGAVAQHGHAAAPARSAAQDRPYSDIGCATILTPDFERQMCFSDFKETGKEPSGLLTASVAMTVQKRNVSEGHGVGSWVRACGDSFQIRFVSTRALFAPDYEETSCGVHTMEFIIAPDAHAFLPDVWLIHVNGEGMADPDPPRHSPAQLSSWNDGPTYYNVRAEFTGKLHLPDWYVVDAFEAPFGGHQPGSAETARINKMEPETQVGQLPICEGQDVPGRWVYTHSLYPEIPGEPLVWRPYGCQHHYYTGRALNKCVEQLGRIKFIGESTLGEALAIWQMHLNHSDFYWPQKVHIGESKVYYARLDSIRGQGQHGEFHGMMRVEEWAIDELRTWSPDYIVMLEGANDAARDTLASFEVRMRRWLANLESNITAGLITRPKGIVYVTCPTRHYKWSGHPGRAVCPDGAHNFETCQHTFGGSDDWRRFNGEMLWEYQSIKASVHLFFGTLERRKAVNKMAKAIMREHFKDVRIVDYEAFTASLPTDYSIDGEHWGCRMDVWKGQREMSAYQCKGLGNTMVANLIANALCNGRTQISKW